MDLSSDPEHEAELETWRGRLIDRLEDRPEGFTDGDELLGGREDFGKTV